MNQFDNVTEDDVVPHAYQDEHRLVVGSYAMEQQHLQSGTSKPASFTQSTGAA